MLTDCISEEDLRLLRTKCPSADIGRFEKVFLYITTSCQLSCSHCYLGSRLNNSMSMSTEEALNNLIIWRQLGAKSVCILGGEPSLHPHLGLIVKAARSQGYERVILDTNGLDPSLDTIRQFKPSELSYIQVSLDGGNTKAHETIRGPGTYAQVHNTICELVGLGFDVRLICTVGRSNIKGALDVLKLSDSLGITLVKYHISSPIGNMAGKPDQVMSPKEWNTFTDKLRCLSVGYTISVQYQPSYIRKNIANIYRNSDYNGCLGRKLGRVSIFPDGAAYACSFLFDTDLNFATVHERRVSIRHTYSELDLFSSSCVTCSQCADHDFCQGGCPAESIVLGAKTCSEHPQYHAMCRLWKAISPNEYVGEAEC